MEPLIIYLLIINAVSLVIMLVDKHNAIHNLNRIPERGLFALSILGGSIGCLLGMCLFHHKTRKRRFSVGFPLILVLQLILAVILYST